MTLPPDSNSLAQEDLNRLKKRAFESEQLLSSLKDELEELTSLYVVKRNRELTVRLTHENAVLKHQVEEQKNVLNKLELKNKVPQVPRPPFPRQAGTSMSTSAAPPPQVSADNGTLKDENKPVKQAKAAKKDQTKKPSGEVNSSSNKQEAPVDVSRLDLRVGRIVSAKKHPDADALYVEEVDVGEDQPRTVVSGLVKFVPLEQMQNRMAVLLCNLKPAKMRGVTSQAMVMCASTPEKVEILDPPSGCHPGDQVHVEGYTRNPDPVLNPKHKVFETVAPDLKTDSKRVATYKGAALHVPGKGNVTAPSLTEVQVK
ncbi:Aminoacyl tRNA synthase complex-interacting multifunctional protein 1 [Frankliniella fusca]|uniref:Aminoacyl tRNA synthase complex-interacting multifunctional protein 1 n=1 Tax=Frankliniella fusca TaxID=407009 RepID=A0AAE1LPN6_9NEOP|nr:Aminoacyl tRNA synthase complex-interacting multifunctional protein 1 [Frankliniella fusca]